MHIAMIGAGYVGLTTSTCLAKLGHVVWCHDIDLERIERIEAGDIPIFEPGLAEAIMDVRESGNLHFSASAASTVADATAIMLAVGTPSRPDGDIDITQVESAARLIAPHLASGAVVIIKSTVSVGTSRRIREAIAETRGSLDFSVASNPEFLREGSAMADFLYPDRIVIGADDRHSAQVLQAIYAPLVKQNDVPILLTGTANAELIKHAANAFLALKIGFINDVANLCEEAGADILEVAQGIGLDHRIGSNFLMPGPGYGGSCFPKDTRAFAATARRHNAPQPLIEALIARNDERKAQLARRVINVAGKRSARVCILGAAFKKNTDDVRESPAITIIAELLNAGLKVAAHDPQARRNAERLLPAACWADCPYEAARESELVVIATEWDDYRELDLPRLASLMSGRRVFDFRNVLDPAAAQAAGLDYWGIGRAKAPARRLRASAGTGSPAFDRSVAAPGLL